MSILVSLIVGGIIGWLAAKVAGRDEGILGSVAIGIIGSIIGGFLSSVLGAGGHAYLAFSWASLIWSFVGALILAMLLNALQHNSHRRTGV